LHKNYEESKVEKQKRPLKTEAFFYAKIMKKWGGLKGYCQDFLDAV
jgi:hypothetical protein